MGVAAPHSGATAPSYGFPYFALTELVYKPILPEAKVDQFRFSVGFIRLEHNVRELDVSVTNTL